MKSKLWKKQDFLFYLLWIGAALVTIKSIFTDFGIDNGYAIATSYRHIYGDRMFLEMWEPHQTSAFLVDLLMRIYGFFVPSLTGVAVYLQVMGVLLWIPILAVLFRELSKHTDRRIAQLICLFLFVFRPKQTVFPEFSNMQIGFSILFFVFLVKYLLEQTGWRYLILSAVFLCLEIISYPTCLIAYLAAAGILLRYARQKGKSLLIFSGVCFVLGALYTGYFILRRGFWVFFDSLRLLVEADASHTGNKMALSQYFQVFAEAGIYLAATLAIAAAVRVVIRKWKEIPFLAVFGVVLPVTAGILLLLLAWRKQVGYEWHYGIVLVLLIGMGLLGYRRLGETGRMIWFSGALISLSSFFAVAVLTNCALMSVVAYLPLAAAVSMMVLPKFRKGTFFAGAVLLFVLLHRGWIVWGYSQLSYHSYVNEVESVIRTGPAKGIICDDFTSCVYRDNAVDFERFIQPEDKVLFLMDWGYDPLFYVQAGVEVSISSTISSPTYDQGQIDYWNRYPEKMPTLVAMACYDGKFTLNRYTYQTMFEWVEEHYDCVGDGTWWRFYRIKSKTAL